MSFRVPRSVLLVLALVATLSGAIAGTAVAQDDPRFRLKVEADAAERDRLAAAGYDIAGWNLSGNWVEVVAGRDDLQRLARDGFRYEILEARQGPRPLRDEGLDGPLPDTKYTDPAELELFLDQVAADHPAITRLEALGTTHDGRTIWGMMISDNASVDEDELSILFNGAHHAREVMTPEVVMDIIDHLTDNYGTDPEITARVDAHEIWCVPMVNPDGVARVHEVDDYWRKNLRDNDDDGDIDGQDGVDLNRNYEWGWGYQCRGSSGTWSSSTYRGPTEGSEPEPQAMLRLGRGIRPVFDVEYHSYGEDVFYAMSCDPQFNPKLSTVAGPDQDISRVIAEEFASRIVQADGGLGYGAAPYGSRVDGTGRDHQYHENGAIAFVTEINTSLEGGFHPDYDTWRDATVEGQRPGWLYLIDRISGPAVGGRVLDATTMLPLEADVSLDELSLPDGKRLTSDGDTGRFHIIVVPGSYTLRAGAPGYQDAEVAVVVAGAWVTQDVLLQPSGSVPILAEDFENPSSAALWTVGAPGDTATSGIWEYGEPEGTHTGDVVNGNLRFGNPRLDRTPGEGARAFVTGNFPAASFDQDDVDGGATTLISPSYDLGAYYGVHVAWQRWFAKDPTDPTDLMTAEYSADGGGTWHTLETLDLPTSSGAATPAWTATSFLLDGIADPGADVRFRFLVNDDLADSTVEAAVDDLVLHGYLLATQGRVAGVRVDGAGGTVLSWDPVPGGGSVVYDVVRGDLSSLSGGPSGVDLGGLACIEDDSADSSTGSDPDTETPAPGSGFFYLVRFQLGFTTGDLGEGSEGGIRAGSGGCP